MKIVIFHAANSPYPAQNDYWVVYSKQNVHYLCEANMGNMQGNCISCINQEHYGNEFSFININNMHITMPGRLPHYLAWPCEICFLVVYVIRAIGTIDLFFQRFLGMATLKINIFSFLNFLHESCYKNSKLRTTFPWNVIKN
jgi:hypothetical protein